LKSLAEKYHLNPAEARRFLKRKLGTDWTSEFRDFLSHAGLPI
jgi:hypothetical protein